MICHYWHCKDIGYDYQPYICNKCHDLSMVVYDLKDFMILNIKGVDYRCYVFNMNKNDAINLLNNSVLDNKVHLEEPILETFILVLMINGIESHGKNLMIWRILIKSAIAQIIMMLVLINIVSSVEHH